MMRPLPGRIVIATGNRGKLRELSELLADLGVEVVAQSDLGVEPVAETGSTFVENALIKARHAAAETGLPAIADDSGLAVDALDGRPGVRSARYAGCDADDDRNIDKLLGELEGVEDRGAAFHCAACFVAPEGQEPVLATGEWRGTILSERRGEHGFGYDPVFWDDELQSSAAELSSDQKNARSHRGRALRQLVRKLRER